MKTAIEIMDNHINIALDQLHEIKLFLNGDKPFIDTVDWKAWYVDTHLSFVHGRENYNSTGYNKLVNLKQKIEEIFNLLEVKDYTILDKKEFDVKFTRKYKNGGVVEFQNKDFSQQIQTLYTGFYLRLINLINDYRGKNNMETIKTLDKDSQKKLEEESEYIDKWFDTTIKLTEWRGNRNIDHWDSIDQCGLNENEIEEIEQHQFQLFHEAVNNSVQNKIKRLIEKPKNIRNEIINEHLRLIDVFTKSTEIKPVIIDLLKPIVLFREKDYLKILIDYQKVIRCEYDNFKENFNISQKNLFSDGSYFIASIIFEYKKAITELAENKLQDKKEKSTQPEQENQFNKTVDNEKNSTLQNKIYDYFKNMDNDKGCEYAFRSETDCLEFTEILTNFFDEKPYNLPKVSTELKKDSKTKLGRVLGEIHKEFGKLKLANDNNFLKIIRTLNHFENENDKDLRKILQR